jgi:uncharacterized protein (TIGR02246 family)
MLIPAKDTSLIPYEGEVSSLYHRVIASWNARDAGAFAASFALDGSMIGFDGTAIDGRAALESHLRAIFDHHRTPHYVTIVREVRRIGPRAALLRAAAGMRTDGSEQLNPALHTIQSLVAVAAGGQWLAALFQSTPAALHGRPEAVSALTAELESLRDRER